MDSSFRTLLNDFDFDVETFEKYKIHSLSKLMDNCINEVKKQRVLKLLSISELEFDCLHDVYKEQIETQTKAKMTMEFPQSLIDEYDIYKIFQINIIKWYNKFIESIKKNNKEEVITIWSTKKVHRDGAQRNYIVYRGQFKRKCNDEILKYIINKEIPGYYFAGNSLSHICYKITNIEIKEPRTSEEPPEYKILVEKILETDVLQNEFPEYYNNTYRHPFTRIKLTSLAKYGFVPQTTDKLDSGIIQAYKINM